MFHNIIIRLPNWIGDFVMATPVLTDVRNRFPNARITIMGPHPVCSLLKYEKAVDAMICFTDEGSSKRLPLYKIISLLRREKYDLGILLTNSFSSACWFWLGAIERRIGYALDWRSPLLTDRIEPPDRKMHQVDYYKHLLRSIRIAGSETAPRLIINDDEKIESLSFLEKLGWRPGQPLFGIHSSAAYGSAKCWPPKRFRQLAIRLLEDPSAFCLFLGTIDNAAQIHSICANLSSRAINLAGRTHIRQLACLIDRCDVLITNDSGPMHMASALATPIVALFGSTDEIATGPWGQRQAVINKHVSCSPCFQRKCFFDLHCMNRIEVEEVFQKALKRKRRHV
jgi:heptosyltransferase-2